MPCPISDAYWHQISDLTIGSDGFILITNKNADKKSYMQDHARFFAQVLIGS